MSIEGMRGANSTIAGNLPGSEVFMAPVAETLTGTYAIPYPVQFKDRVLPNIKFVFDKGKIQSFDIYYKDENDTKRAEDIAFIEKVINSDAGAKTVGELGIGTNPKVDKPYLNTLLIEKVGGSIHLAIGNSYINKDDAIIDNGNRSKIHIDLTRIMLPEYGGGEIQVDGEVFQKDGKFVAPELAILNRN